MNHIRRNTKNILLAVLVVMAKKGDEDFKNSTKSWICDNVYVKGNVTVRDHCQITGKYRGSAHKNCNIKVKLNHKIPIVFHNLKNYDFHFIMQELGKFNFKRNIIPNGLETYMSFHINDNLSFIKFPNFQFFFG